MNNPEQQIISVENCTVRLQELMQAAGINSLKQLYQ
ncbi:MAG: hypothetical protein RLZZ135_324, partial [Cyanobacteriota bacterium]